MPLRIRASWSEGLGEAYWGAMAKCLCVCHPSTRNLIFFLCNNGLDSRNGLAESVFTTSPNSDFADFSSIFRHLQHTISVTFPQDLQTQNISAWNFHPTDTRCSINFFLPNDKRNENSSEMLFYVLCHNTQLTSVAVFIFPAISRIVGRMNQLFGGWRKQRTKICITAKQKHKQKKNSISTERAERRQEYIK